MNRWKKNILHFFNGADDFIDQIQYKFRKRFHLYQRLYITTYNSYGTKESLNIKGHVLKNNKIQPAEEDDSVFVNILNNYKRFYGEGVAGALVWISFQDSSHTVLSDEKGYFETNIVPSSALPVQLWHEVSLELKAAPMPFKGVVKAVARVEVPFKNTDFGIISDIDDTIIKSHVTTKIKMFRTVAFKNAFTRRPFEGVSAFYTALQKGLSGHSENPFFYVSSSPWKLNDFLMDFLEINAIPEGAFLLKNLGMLDDRKTLKGHKLHKLNAINKILNTYPNLPFILIGDSGQKDAIIYEEVVKKFPRRIMVIYIRDVQLAKQRKAVMAVAENMPDGITKLILVDNMANAMAHAIKNKYIKLKGH
jgi:phosphatidate phosphatase APP1